MDSASLSINGEVAGSFDCQGGVVTVDLPYGDVTIVVTYSDYGWTDQMVLHWNGPDSGNSWQIVPADAFKPGNTACTMPEIEAPKKEEKCHYKHLDGDSGCGVMDGGRPNMHESCMCFQSPGEADIMPWCESACDDDADCKGYVGRSAFGMQTCMLATTSSCPTDHQCMKQNVGVTGDIVPFVQPFSGFKGCFVKDCEGSSLAESSTEKAAVRIHDSS